MFELKRGALNTYLGVKSTKEALKALGKRLGYKTLAEFKKGQSGFFSGKKLLFYEVNVVPSLGRVAQGKLSLKEDIAMSPETTGIDPEDLKTAIATAKKNLEEGCKK